jgi:hypothetical protein
VLLEHDPEKLVPDVIRDGHEFPACAKPSNHPFIPLDASAGEGRSEKIMRKQSAAPAVANPPIP